MSGPSHQEHPKRERGLSEAHNQFFRRLVFTFSGQNLNEMLMDWMLIVEPYFDLHR